MGVHFGVLQHQGGEIFYINGKDAIDVEFIDEKPTGQISGRVYDEQGNPVNGVVVKAVSNSLTDEDKFYSVIQTVVHGPQHQLTDEKGEFLIENLVEDVDYNLHIQHPGMNTVLKRHLFSGDYVDVYLAHKNKDNENPASN